MVLKMIVTPITLKMIASNGEAMLKCEVVPRADCRMMQAISIDHRQADGPADDAFSPQPDPVGLRLRHEPRDRPQEDRDRGQELHRLDPRVEAEDQPRVADRQQRDDDERQHHRGADPEQQRIAVAQLGRSSA